VGVDLIFYLMGFLFILGTNKCDTNTMLAQPCRNDLLFGPKLLINAGTLSPRVANWLPNFDGILFNFQPWGQYKAIKFSIY
jgi:hypothetical protein